MIEIEHRQVVLTDDHHDGTGADIQPDKTQTTVMYKIAEQKVISMESSNHCQLFGVEATNHQLAMMGRSVSLEIVLFK